MEEFVFDPQPRDRRPIDRVRITPEQPLAQWTGQDYSDNQMMSALQFAGGHEMPGWHSEGVCRTLPSEWFFGREDDEGVPVHRPTLNIAEVKRARRICGICPVQEECRNWGLNRHEEFGIWGGLTGRDRKRIWRELGEEVPWLRSKEDDTLEAI